MKSMCLLVVCLLSSLALTSHAQQTAYETSADVAAFDTQGSPAVQQNNYSVNSAPSSSTLSSSLTANGFTMNFNGYAAADRNILHASSSMNIVPPANCTAPCANPNYMSVFSYGTYDELGVHAIQVGPGDLLSGIVAYEVTFNLDGTVSGPAQMSADLIAAACPMQGGSCNSSGSRYDETTPLGPVTFYITPLNPSDPSAAFDAFFGLQTEVLYQPGSFYGQYGTIDFGDTAAITSFAAVDGNHNPIPGVEIEYSDGSTWGPDGFVATGTAPTAPTPEPSTFLMLSTGLIGIAGTIRRRLKG